MIDTFGVLEYYSDKIGEIENAENGLIRVVRCIERRGVCHASGGAALPRDGPESCGTGRRVSQLTRKRLRPQRLPAPPR